MLAHWDKNDLKIIAQAKERLLLHYIDENEVLYKILSQRAEDLSQKNQDLEKLSLGIIETLARTLEAKDQYTEGHSQRVADYASLIAQELNLSLETIQKIRLASILHDIGKIGIPEQVLRKPAKLSAEEFEYIKSHPTIAARMLEPLDVLKPLVPWIEFHHERYDGKGYPKGIDGNVIPLGAKIISVADSFDAMTSDRPYRTALSQDVAISEIRQNAGTQFDPVVAKTFLKVIQVE
jgi:putative nucleotidyltransferase with HDIG domain